MFLLLVGVIKRVSEQVKKNLKQFGWNCTKYSADKVELVSLSHKNIGHTWQTQPGL